MRDNTGMKPEHLPFRHLLHSMPLPTAPTQKPNNTNVRRKANNELLLKGFLCTFIGLGVLVSPYFITSPGMQGIVARSSLVGWFALVLGVAFIGLYMKRRMAETVKS
jgi:hypothetical protein